MNRLGPVRNISIRVPAPILVLATLVLIHSTSAGQNNPGSEMAPRPGISSNNLVSNPSEPSKAHEATTRDITAIGERGAGCTRRLGDRYSREAQEVDQSYARNMETTSKFITDPVIAEYMNRIGETLARKSDAQVQLTLKVIDNDEVNAFSLPGGFIFVNSGLILAADNEAELAGVISHEIAHIVACHGMQQEIARQAPTDVTSMPLIFRLAVRHITRNTIYVIPTRRFESEADFLGAEYLYKAGYDPQALPSFFEKLRAMEQNNRGDGANAFGSHPQIADRIERTQHEINTILPLESEYKLDTSEFQEIKKRLSELDNGRKLYERHSAGGHVVVIDQSKRP